MKFFKRFLLNHVDTLEEIFLKQEINFRQIRSNQNELLAMLKSFRNLKTFKSFNFPLPFEVLPRVENLSIQRSNPRFLPPSSSLNPFDSIFRNFPNLRSLTLISVGRVRMSLRSLAKLESLSLENCSICGDFDMQRLKRVSFTDFKLTPVIFYQGSFDELTLESCEDLKCLLHWLRREESRLKFLKLESCEMTREDLEFIRSLSGGKVKHLVVTNCSEIEEVEVEEEEEEEIEH